MCGIPNNRIVHHWLVGLVLEVGFPALFEVGGGPGFKLLELGGSWANLDACFDAVRSKGAGSLNVPLLKNTWGKLVRLSLQGFEKGRTLLHFGVSAGEVVECFRARLGPVDGEGKVVVLEVETDTWEINDGLDSDTTEFVGIAWTTSILEIDGARGRPTDSRPLENQRG